MDNSFNLVAVIFIIFGVLQIILFFKLWGMTNNVRKMKEMLESTIEKYSSKTEEKHPNRVVCNTPKSSNGSWGKNISDEEKEKVKNMIINLPEGASIVKITATGKIKVYKTDELAERVDENYEVIYYK